MFLVALLAGATCQPTPGEVLVARALGRAQSVPDAGVVSEVEGAQGGADAEEVTKVDKAPTDPDAEEVDEEDKSQDDPNAGEVSVVEEAQGHPDSDYYEDVAEVESSQIDPDGGDVGEEEEAQDDQNVRVVPEDRTEKVGDSEDRTGEVALIDPDPDARLAAETSRTHLHQFHKGIIIKQLLTILFTAFISSITTTIVNCKPNSVLLS